MASAWVLLSLVLFGCESWQVGAPEVFRRNVSPRALLYQGSDFDGVALFTALTHEKAQVVPGRTGPKTYTAGWYSDSVHVTLREYVYKASSDADAQARYHNENPRGAAISDNDGNADAVGKFTPEPVSGEPDSSQIFCAQIYNGSEDSSCAAWTWWARYGEYNIEFDYLGIYPGSFQFLTSAQFTVVVNLAAKRVATELGP